jgi:hypothetical protein
MTTIETLADAQIETLRDEAGAAGDVAMVRICALAMAGDERARRDVVEAIGAAEAMA